MQPSVCFSVPLYAYVDVSLEIQSSYFNYCAVLHQLLYRQCLCTGMHFQSASKKEPVRNAPYYNQTLNERNYVRRVVRIPQLKAKNLEYFCILLYG